MAHTLDDILKLSAAELEALTDDQLKEYFKPYLDNQAKQFSAPKKPSKVNLEKVSGPKRTSEKETFKQMLDMAKQYGLDVKDLPKM